MDRKYLLESAIKVARFSRLMAKAIDLFIVLVLSIFFYPIGIIISIAYMSVADAIQNGQSVGKKFIGFSVISLEDGTPCSVKQSFVRNLPIIIPLIFAVIPFFGWLIAIVIGVPFIALEVYLLYKLDSGHRLGDVMADTTVMANDGTLLQIKKRKTSWFEGEKI
ncbi:RDD family protein [Bacteriovorax sp. Seq25_V]|uniref:RDD family protein n=1 Tax=Bacteriovorax sp. Seq25_V TaxID=1201288 RepID=UPI00038A1A70|nr:RDD family protein [Bacteriovorax sp. Seq25_V]EQC44772.1 RDD domain protein [Bacteriovorax sp. Seq25_V]